MDSRTSLLLVDDDRELLDMLCAYLEREGYAVATAHDGRSGLAQALSGSHKLLVLDVMMPDMTGLDVLRALRQSSDLPVIMLTARGDDVDKVVGLELGADDYVPKPCTPRELLARIRAILRRTGQTRAQAPVAVTGGITVGALSLLPAQRRAEWAGQVLPLTSAEFSILELLARHAGQPVSKGDLSEYALARPLERFDRSVDVHISSIRQKLGTRPDGGSPIQTVFRRGYLLVKD